MAEGLRVVAVILFACAVVSVLLAVLLYFTLHIRDVRRDLTGQTAQKYIAELSRSHGRWASEYAHQGARRSVEDNVVAEQDPAWNSADFNDGLSEKRGTSSASNEAETEDGWETTLMGSQDDDTVSSPVASTEEADSATSLLGSFHDRQQDASSPTYDDVEAFEEEEDSGTTLLSDANQGVETTEYRHADNDSIPLFGSGKVE